MLETNLLRAHVIGVSEGTSGGRCTRRRRGTYVVGGGGRVVRGATARRGGYTRRGDGAYVVERGHVVRAGRTL